MLSGPEIAARVAAGQIVIEPYDPARLNPNSYNLTLAPTLKVYTGSALDPARDNPTDNLEIPAAGLLLMPRTLYLASTAEWTETHGLVPMLNGRSGLGRLGLAVHVTAGFGDAGFRGRWTLELTCVHPVRVYADMAVCQIAYFPLVGAPAAYAGKYQDAEDAQASRTFREFGPNRREGGRL